MLIWRKLHLFEEKLKWWQLKTWMVKLNEQKLLKKTVVAVFFFSSLMPWLNRTWFFLFFIFIFSYFFHCQAKENPKQWFGVITSSWTISKQIIYVSRICIFLWATKTFSRAYNTQYCIVSTRKMLLVASELYFRFFKTGSRSHISHRASETKLLFYHFNDSSVKETSEEMHLGMLLNFKSIANLY